MDKILPYGSPSISDEDRKAVLEALESTTLTRGPRTEAFEAALAKYVGAEYAVSFNSGSTALAASYFAGGVSSKDRVLTTPNTFIATVGPAMQQGAQPVFIDIDRKSGNFQQDQAELNLSYPSLSGKLFVAPVHFAGIAVDMAALSQKIQATNVIVIEDAAHALGSQYPDGQMVGCCANSDMTIFSFHPVKTISTGEGGMVTTNDPEMARRLKLYRNNGIVRDLPEMKGPWEYQVRELTGNYHITEIQAALGTSQLARIDQFIEKRRSLVQRYRTHLEGVANIRLFDAAYDERTAYHLFVVQIDFEKLKMTKERAMERLKAKGIGTQYHYIPLYRHPAVSRITGDIEEYFPEMEAYFKQALSLPLYYDLTIEEVDRIAAAVKQLAV